MLYEDDSRKSIKRTAKYLEIEESRLPEKKIREDKILHSHLSLEDKIKESFKNGVSEIKIVLKSKDPEKVKLTHSDIRKDFQGALNREDDAILSRNNNIIVIARSANSAINLVQKKSINKKEIISHLTEDSYTTQYIIKNLDTSVSLAYLHECLELQGIKPNKIIRFTKKGTDEVIPVVLVQELGFVIRNKIKIDYLFYNTSRFLQKPKICYRCLRFGHFAKSCGAKDIKCVRCGGNHDTQICSEEKQSCFRCGSVDHSALDSTCPVVKKESDKLNSPGGEKLANTEKKLYSAAVKPKENGSLGQSPSEGVIAQGKFKELTEKIARLEKVVFGLTETISDLCSKVALNQSRHQSESISTFDNLDECITQSIESKVVQPLENITAASTRLSETLIEYIRVSIDRDNRVLPDPQQDNQSRETARKQDFEELHQLIISTQLTFFNQLAQHFAETYDQKLNKIIEVLGADRSSDSAKLMEDRTY